MRETTKRLLLSLFLWTLAAPLPLSLHSAESPPRIPWTTSRVSGSPEPPSPYTLQRIFPKVTFDRPVDIAFAPGSKRLFIALEKGKIFSIPNDPNVEQPDIFLDPGEILNLDKIPDCRNVHSVLALTFHPDFAKNRYCYVEYNLRYKTEKRNHENGSRVSRFTVLDSDPPRIDPKSEVIFLQWLSGGHNGCALKFGPDGFLYVSLGDGADPDPPDDMNTGQNIGDLLSSVLRIDVDHPGKSEPYSVPPDNPFVSTPGARPEVYAYGLRNPFRMNFDSKTGNLWLGDVGWELYESVHCIKPGGNYGWSIMEGPNPVHPNGKRGPTEIIKPQAALSHAEAASLTGGLVYRGQKLPALYGQYLFGDWQTSRLWAAKCKGEKEDALEPYVEIAQTDSRIVAFGEDAEHEPIIVDHGGGGLFRIVANPQAGRKTDFPRRLSETGLFDSVPNQTPAAGVVPFSINAAQWLDGASAERWIAVPGTAKVEWGKGVWGDPKPSWPKDSVLVRTISLELQAGDPSTRKQIETQLLHFDGQQWRGYSYAWNEARTDAELLPSGGEDRPFTICDAAAPGGWRRQNWHYPSRTQCMTCHNVWCDFAMSFNPPQLDRLADIRNPDGKLAKENQVAAFRRAGLLLEAKVEEPRKPKPGQPPPPPDERQTLTDPYDTAADVNERARSYLHVNCSHCHRFGGGGTALIDVRKEQHPSELKAIGERPALGDFGLDNGKLICAGDPNRSVLLYRASKLGKGRMPHIGSDVVDTQGMQLLREWMKQLAPADTTAAKASDEREKLLKALADPAASDAARAHTVTQLLSSTSGALALIGEIESGKISPAARQSAITQGIAAAQEPVRDLFRRYDPSEQFKVRLGTSIDPAKLLALSGDAVRGRKIFFESSGGLCAKCHRVNGQGTDFGPDQSHVATKYTKAQLLENIVEPSKTIAEGFTSYLVKTKSGELLTGLLVKRSETEIVLKDAQKQFTIPAADVVKLTPSKTSAMPEGLLAELTPQDGADLLEYLNTLK